MFRIVATTTVAVATAGAWAQVKTQYPVQAQPVQAAPVQAQGGANGYFIDGKDKDFGVTAVGPTLVHYFPIKNTSNQEVTLGTPRIQCGCVSVTLMKAKIAPGETTHLVAYMNTAKIPAQQIGTNKLVTVNVPFIAPVLEEVTLKLSCVARPDMVWSTNDGVSFGTVTKGKTAKQAMTVTLYNNPKWAVTEIKSGGDYVKAEVKEKSRTNVEVTYEVTATLTENCPKGNWMSDLTVKTNAPGIESMRIPVTVNVENPIRVTPEVVNLGVLPAGGTRTVDVTITGLEKFKVLEVKGADDKVSVTPTAADSKQFHSLKLQVKADASGNLTRDIQIVTDSKEMPTVVLPVSYTVAK
jgi:hypothetical protein